MGTNKAEETPLKKMNSDRIKEIQETTSCPNSTSVQQALLQVWNECSQQSQSEIDELTKEVERLRKENNSMLKEKMYFNRMKELVSKVAYDSEHYTQKTYEVLRNDAIGLLNEYNLTTH